MTAGDGTILYPLVRRRMPSAGDASALAVRPAKANSAAVRARCPFGFFLLILATGVLFVRPGDLFPVIGDAPIYEVLIILCLLASLPVVLEQLNRVKLLARPPTLFVLLLLPAVILSHLSHGDIYDARIMAVVVLKVLIYFLLLIGLIDTPARLQKFLIAVVVFISATAVLSLLNWHEILDIPSLAPVSQNEGADDDDQPDLLYRLLGPGIFNDPNDFSLILVAGMLIAARFAVDKVPAPLRLGSVGVIGVLGYALALTSSRGGLISCLAGTGVFVFCRFGWRRAIPVMAVAVGGFLVIFAGRQANFDLDNPEDTFQGRVEIWRDSMVLFHQSPLFGIGAENLADEEGLVAHNSFVHAYTELGIAGGTAFVGAVAAMLTCFWRVRRAGPTFSSAGLYGWWPSLFAVGVAYFTGLFSLSRVYAIGTFVVLGMLAAFLILADRESPGIIRPLTAKLVRRTAITSIGMIAFLEFLVRVIHT
jgi:O-antigen ligase